MPPKRGLSLEEKRSRLLEVFHESKDVFVLKDVEKLGAKKGIVAQSIKEVLQSLVDDDLVHQERIGASNFYWSFPGEAAAKVDQSIKRLQQQDADLAQQQETLKQQIQEETARKPDAAKLAPKLAQMKALEQKQALLAAGLAQYAENDPERIEVLRSGTVTAKDWANTWLDNIECLRTFVKKMNEGREGDIDDFFAQEGATDKLETLDD